MGGLGSGCWVRTGRKTLTEDCHSIDVRYWKRQRWLYTGSQLKYSNGLQVNIRYDTVQLLIEGNAYQSGTSQQIKLAYRHCHLGGKRPYLICPGCQQLVFKLYQQFGRYHCRRCNHLAYDSQSEGTLFRILHRAKRIIKKLEHYERLIKSSHAKARSNNLDQVYRLVAELKKMREITMAVLTQWCKKMQPEVDDWSHLEQELMDSSQLITLDVDIPDLPYEDWV